MRSRMPGRKNGETQHAEMVSTCVLGCSWTTPDAKGFYYRGYVQTTVLVLYGILSNHSQTQRYFLHILCSCYCSLKEICMYENT